MALGDKINQGDLLLTLEPVAAGQGGETSADEPEPPAELADAEAPGTDDAPAAQTQAPQAGAVEIREVTLPDIGDFTDVEIIELLASPGDSVEAEQSLLTLESDKATMEIPAPFAGTLKSIDVALGDKVNQGDLIARIETVVASEMVEPTAPPAEPPKTIEPARAEEKASSRQRHGRSSSGVGACASCSP